MEVGIIPQKKLPRALARSAAIPMILRVILYVLASWVLAAHFLRQGMMLPVLVCVAMPLLFLVHKPWSRVVLQAFIYGAAMVWLFTAVELAHARMAEGLPWTRAAAILGVVALVSLCSGLLLNSRVFKSSS